MKRGELAQLREENERLAFERDDAITKLDKAHQALRAILGETALLDTHPCVGRGCRGGLVEDSASEPLRVCPDCNGTGRRPVPNSELGGSP